MRWGIVEKIFQVVFNWCRNLLYQMPYNDQVLKSVIIRAALKYSTPLPEISDIEASILKKLQRK